MGFCMRNLYDLMINNNMKSRDERDFFILIM